MPAMIVQGDKELIRAFQEMPRKAQTQIVRRALRPAGKVLLAATRAATPVYAGPPVPRIIPGILRRTIKLYVSKFNRRGQYSMYIAPPSREKLGIPAKAKHYWPAALEFGHGRAAPRSYLRGPFDALQPGLAGKIAFDIGRMVEEHYLE